MPEKRKFGYKEVEGINFNRVAVNHKTLADMDPDEVVEAFKNIKKEKPTQADEQV